MSTNLIKQRWQAILQELSDPDVDLDSENAAVVVSTFELLRTAGHRFDRALGIVMDKLKQQLIDLVGDDDEPEPSEEDEPPEDDDPREDDDPGGSDDDLPEMLGDDDEPNFPDIPAADERHMTRILKRHSMTELRNLRDGPALRTEITKQLVRDYLRQKRQVR